VIFLVADFTRRFNWWDQKPGFRDVPLMTSGQIREMAEGGIEFGSHAVTHRILTGLSARELERELVDSRSRIQDITGREVRSIAYPYGIADGRIVEAAEQAGYSCGFCVTERPSGVGRSIYAIPRTNMTSMFHPAGLSLKLSTSYSFWRQLKAVGKRLSTPGQIIPESPKERSRSTMRSEPRHGFRMHEVKE
jgi:peptidoglycan/xylan/chitin deacetylase (PgdA/CDA1 family)